MAQFLTESQIQVYDQPGRAPHAIWFNSYKSPSTFIPQNLPYNGTWTTVDVSSLVPSGTKAIFVQGILILTHGTNSQLADMKVAFRQTGDTDDAPYNMQVIEAHVSGGQRSTAGQWIPLDSNGCFDVKISTDNPTGQWPSYASYGASLRINAVAT